MAKKFILYANGKEFATLPITQNENGTYYWNGSSYYTPTLGNFDNATLPSGYKKYTNGSHAVYKTNSKRHPLDISLVAGTVITANFDVYMRGYTYSGGSWCKVQMAGLSNMLGLVHTYKWASIGLVKAGQPICVVAPKSVTGFAPHLHLDEWTGYKVRELILKGDFNMATQLAVGDKVQIVGGDMNVRKGAGTGFGYVTGKELALKEGAVVQIKDGIRTSQNKLFYGKGSTINVNDTYQWIDVQDASGQSGWIAITNRVEKVHGNTNLTTFDVTPPEEEKPECEKQLDILQKENNTLRIEQGALKQENTDIKAQIKDTLGKLTVAVERIEYLETTLEERNKENDILTGEIEEIKKEKSRIEQDRLKIQEELEQLKKGRDDWINKLADALHKLFGMK